MDEDKLTYMKERNKLLGSKNSLCSKLKTMKNLLSIRI